MPKQPFYHHASILFTVVDNTLNRDEVTRLLQRAIGQLTECGLEGVLPDSVECEEVDSEAGDPHDL